MMIFNIITPSPELGGKINELLISREYAIDVFMNSTSSITTSPEKKYFYIHFITKALLFDTIERELKEEFGLKDCIMYGTPISYMNAFASEDLRSRLAKV